MSACGCMHVGLCLCVCAHENLCLHVGLCVCTYGSVSTHGSISLCACVGLCLQVDLILCVHMWDVCTCVGCESACVCTFGYESTCVCSVDLRLCLYLCRSLCVGLSLYACMCGSVSACIGICTHEQVLWLYTVPVFIHGPSQILNLTGPSLALQGSGCWVVPAH